MHKENCKTGEAISDIAYFNTRAADKTAGVTHVLQVRLALITYDKKNRQKDSRTYRGRSLNFCPECGVEIKERAWRM